MGAVERVVAVGAVLSVLAAPVSAPALGARYPDHVARAAGTRTDLVAALTGESMRWRVEVSDRRLFEDADLRASGVRFSAAAAGAFVGVDLAQIAAVPGSESSAVLRIGTLRRRWTLEVAAAYDEAFVPGARRSWLASMSVRNEVTVGTHVRFRCDVDGIPVAGVERDGADISSGVVFIDPSGVALASSLVIDRYAGAYGLVSVALCLAARAVVVAGYDDGTDSLSLAVALVAMGVRASAGAWVHPVLGVSRGASVGWGR